MQPNSYTVVRHLTELFQSPHFFHFLYESKIKKKHSPSILKDTLVSETVISAEFALDIRKQNVRFWGEKGANCHSIPKTIILLTLNFIEKIAIYGLR